MCMDDRVHETLPVFTLSQLMLHFLQLLRGRFLCFIWSAVDFLGKLGLPALQMSLVILAWWFSNFQHGVGSHHGKRTSSGLRSWHWSWGCCGELQRSLPHQAASQREGRQGGQDINACVHLSSRQRVLVCVTNLFISHILQLKIRWNGSTVGKWMRHYEEQWRISITVLQLAFTCMWQLVCTQRYPFSWNASELSKWTRCHQHSRSVLSPSMWFKISTIHHLRRPHHWFYSILL